MGIAFLIISILALICLYSISVSMGIIAEKRMEDGDV